METKKEHAEHVKQELSLGLWEKYLTVWIAICIVVGLLVGRFIPAFGEFMDSLKFAHLSIPIGILLFFMMYPTVLGIRFSDVKMASKNPKPLMVTLIANWVVAPIIMTLYANYFLAGNPQYHSRSDTSRLITLYCHGYVVDASCKRKHGSGFD